MTPKSVMLQSTGPVNWEVARQTAEALLQHHITVVRIAPFGTHPVMRA